MRTLIVSLIVLATAVGPDRAPLGASLDDEPAVLLVDVGIHVEPFGLANGRISSGAGSYDNETYFRRHAEYLRSLATMVERHGGRITFQVQSPFIDSCTKYRDNVIGELAGRGHEIALHFHEDAHLGRSADTLPVERWIEVMEGQLSKIRALGVERVRMWSGGNLYPRLLDAARAVNLDVMSDWKNPRTQTADPRLQVTAPWKPAGSPSATDLSAFVRHDPDGSIVYLPTGVIDPKAMHEEEIDRSSNPAAALQEYWTEGLSASLASVAANPDVTHVFHITLHPGELQMRNYGGDATLERWLTDEIDPLVAAGKARWATYSQMADAYNTRQPTTAASGHRRTAGVAAALSATSLSGPGYITFAVNVHDWKHLDESADTMLKAIAIFEKHRVRGDFYLTGPMATLYARSRPDVIARLRHTGMTISYHVRPPHPLYTGFGARLQALDDDALARAMLEYERYELDLATGDLVPGRPGGYAYVASLLATPPVTIVSPSDDARIRRAAERVYTALGAKAIVTYHETGTRPDRPFEYRGELLIRPSDFSITRWSVDGRAENFWWNMLGSRSAAQYDPVAYLQQRLARWTYDRPPIITSLIHENNFVRSGAEGWTLSYYTDTSRDVPLQAPFDLEARDPSTLRSAADQARIWEAYDRLVGWAAANLSVVTSADLVALAQADEQ